MTPRERAGRIIDRWNLDTVTIGRTFIPQSEMVAAIEQAIIAAVEAEREACAMIAHQTYLASLSGLGLEEAARVSGNIRDAIRARSSPKPS